MFKGEEIIVKHLASLNPKNLSTKTCFESAKNWVYELKFEVVWEKTFILGSGNWKNSILIDFDGENTYFSISYPWFPGVKKGSKMLLNGL